MCGCIACLEFNEQVLRPFCLETKTGLADLVQDKVSDFEHPRCASSKAKNLRLAGFAPLMESGSCLPLPSAGFATTAIFGKPPQTFTRGFLRQYLDHYFLRFMHSQCVANSIFNLLVDEN